MHAAWGEKKIGTTSAVICQRKGGNPRSVKPPYLQPQRGKLQPQLVKLLRIALPLFGHFDLNGEEHSASDELFNTCSGLGSDVSELGTFTPMMIPFGYRAPPIGWQRYAGDHRRARAFRQW